MLEKIAAIAGLRFNEADTFNMAKLQRIADLVPKEFPVGSEGFPHVVETAVKWEDNMGVYMFQEMANALMAEPAERVLLIKSSPKGERIKVAAANGIRYSFGPIWNDSIKKGKGIAFVEANRAKLNHQAGMLGILTPEQLDIAVLATQMVPLLG